MRRRDSAGGRFLVRTEEEWTTVMPYGQSVMMLNRLPKLAASVLAASGLLEAAELSRLGRIAAGAEEHPTIDAESARRALAVSA